MRSALRLTALCALLPALAQEPAAAPTQQAPDLVEAPTRKKPFIIEGTMTVTIEAPGYTAPGGRSGGALLKEGLEGNKNGAPRGRKGGGDAGGMSSNRSYTIQVPPKARLKVQLECRRLRNFNVRFVSETMGRTEDPGLFVNKLHHRDDAAFYENKTDQVKTIHCVLVGVEPINDEPFKLIFTDY